MSASAFDAAAHDAAVYLIVESEVLRLWRNGWNTVEIADHLTALVETDVAEAEIYKILNDWLDRQHAARSPA